MQTKAINGRYETFTKLGYREHDFSYCLDDNSLPQTPPPLDIRATGFTTCYAESINGGLSCLPGGTCGNDGSN